MTRGSGGWASEKLHFMCGHAYRFMASLSTGPAGAPERRESRSWSNERGMIQDVLCSPEADARRCVASRCH